MTNDTTNSTKNRVGPVNKFWIWIVVTLAATVSSIAIWGNGKSETLLNDYKKSNVKLEKINDSLETSNKRLNDTIFYWKLKYSKLESRSVENLIDYSEQLQNFRAKLNKKNDELIKHNNQKLKVINKLNRK
jgi:K+ transporter